MSNLEDLIELIDNELCPPGSKRELRVAKTLLPGIGGKVRASIVDGVDGDYCYRNGVPLSARGVDTLDALQNLARLFG